MYLLVLFDLWEFRSYVVAYYCIIAVSLVSICVSYLTIRLKLNNKVPTINSAHNRKSAEQNTKLSKTLFIVIATSLIFWLPSLVSYCISFLYKELFSDILFNIFGLFHVTNSLVNPIIYSFRMPVFSETLKRMKTKLTFLNQSKNYNVNGGT